MSFNMYNDSSQFDKWYYLKCNDKECYFHTLPSPTTITEDDKFNKDRIIKKYKTKRGRTGNDIRRRRKNFDDKNFSNETNNKWSYNSLYNPVYETFNNKKINKMLYILLSVILCIFVLIYTLHLNNKQN